ncbi:MAG: pyridoxal-dependent decarboxylase [Candidatus Aminicenantes bacterium]|nr:pyridoxal-dependent decarboxylase [Candidatus Aminicenantes bacterium]MDH5384626.1 pyridoxal-dependent decarboxylase [Candidatus Aminicenantes bacterium]MDH5744325.1 pyridoxal-dependent decarboxylase [Candidatus Aminicenantes bacterium]
MDKESFRQFGYTFVDWVVDYFDRIEEFPVKSPLKPGDIRKKLPEKPPIQGEPMDRIFQDFKEIILPGITHWQHPSWFAYFPANNSPPSVLAELLTAGIGAQCMVWQTSPAAAELEEVVLEWLRQMLGLPEGMTGVIQDTASTATLVALLSAREKATDFETNLKGMKRSLMVYASEETHSSIEKGVKIAGYGKENLRYIPTDENFAMIPEKLEEAIVKDKDSGCAPACVIATIGTTSSTAVDPLVPIGKICQRYSVWLHVDAAFSGTAAILPEKKWMLDGIEYVDSFVFNPHKWMLTNFDCSTYFVKDPGTLIRTFEIHPEYLKTGVDAQVKNFRDWGIQLGRRFRALKLWFVLRSYGVEGLQKVVREHIRLAEMFKEWVEDHEHFELMAPVSVSLVCFRLNDGRSEEELNELNRTFLERLNQTGKLLLTQTTLRGKYILRLSIAARLTEERHVREAWELMKSRAEDLLREK